MPEKPYKYFSNAFESVSSGSYRTGRKLGDYTLDALASAEGGAEPFATLHTNLQPSVVNYNNLYAGWKNAMGTQKTRVNSVTSLLAELAGEKIQYWMDLVVPTFGTLSPQFQDIFPDKRKPFNSGSQTDKQTAVLTLKNKLAEYATEPPEEDPLNPVITYVNNFYDALSASMHAKNEKKASVKVDSTALDNARITLCQELYACMGTLMAHFKTQPEAAANYFDMQTLRNREQTSFTANISGGETLLALTHTFEPEEPIRLINKGNTELRFALCAEANDPITEPGVIVPANEDVVVPIEELGNPADQRFLKVQNLDETEGERYTIMLL